MQSSMYVYSYISELLVGNYCICIFFNQNDAFLLTENQNDLWWILDLKINVSKNIAVVFGKEKEWTITVLVKHKW